MTGWALAVAIVGAVSGLVAATLSGVNLYLTGQRETKKWLRDSLLEAQVAFLDASFEYPSRRLYEYLGEYPPGWTADLSSYFQDYHAAHTRQNDALSKIRLLASDDVVARAEELHKVDEKVAMTLFDQENGFPSEEQWEALRSEKREAREAFIRATRHFFDLTDGAPISN
jgi:hypothetical protein